MKIYLERTLPTCSSKLKCITCNNRFAPGRIRSLLYRDNQLIQGDVCPSCLKLGAKGIQQKLRISAAQRMQPRDGEPLSIADYKAALEQFEAAAETIKLPNIFHWWFKQLEILSQETQELETARLGLSQCQCGNRRSRLRITFQDEDAGNP